MTSSRQHAQQAAQELWEKFSPVVTGGTEDERQAIYERWVNERAAIIDRHIAAALAEQAAEQWIDVRQDLPKRLKSEFDGRFSDTVQMYDNRKNQYFGFYDFREKRWAIHQGYEDDTLVVAGVYTITHWRALPQAPK